VIIAGHAFMQNLRRGHYELGIDAAPATRVATACTELARAIQPRPRSGSTRPSIRQRNGAVRMTPEGDRLGPAVRIDNDPFAPPQLVAGWGESPEVVLALEDQRSGKSR
jgi:hypothetical protein